MVPHLYSNSTGEKLTFLKYPKIFLRRIFHTGRIFISNTLTLVKLIRKSAFAIKLKITRNFSGHYLNICVRF